jgi:hypothetical protein
MTKLDSVTAPLAVRRDLMMQYAQCIPREIEFEKIPVSDLGQATPNGQGERNVTGELTRKIMPILFKTGCKKSVKENNTKKV